MTLITPRGQAPSPQAPVSGIQRQPSISEGAAQSPATAEGPAQEGNLSRNIAALARREKEQRRQAEEFKKERLAWESEKSKYETDYIPKSKFTSDPLATLEEAGVDYDQLTNLKLAQGSPELQYIQKLEKKLEALESKQNAASKGFEEQQTQQYQQALRQIGEDVKSLVSQGDDFEGIKATGSEQDVVDEIERVFKEEGRLLTIEEAALKIENYIIEESYKLAQLKKVQGRLTPQVTEDETQKATPQQKTNQGIKTLTNAVSAASNQSLSPRDRRERAIAAFKGQLK